ncbi:hypothetical protein MHLP_01620 [Candidatus Mycoplasma haematolamae str. Purdue]|uniref:Lipoprotein n=1 Tax=Mycoplasma haematolamae (strain Purdue) TaxID=1212765 RepID=I7CJ56_MYCHA|nr:hypothetical protein [Candidatus Mycoplasma haematolamae]AFO51904.1 hypothetical protein MHLP_01620 [Candidatus Mycoplasma haematolamae str. Purdue]
MAFSLFGKVAFTALAAGGTSTAVVYPLMQGKGSYVAFFTGKTSKEVEGILLFSKSLYETEELVRTSDWTYKIDVKTPEQWNNLRERLQGDQEGRDFTDYIPVEIKENNKSEQVVTFLSKMTKELWQAIKDNGGTGEFEQLKKYIEKPEVTSEFKSVFGEETYQSLLKGIAKADSQFKGKSVS